jgi:hypothetical protein
MEREFLRNQNLSLKGPEESRLQTATVAVEQTEMRRVVRECPECPSFEDPNSRRGGRDLRRESERMEGRSSVNVTSLLESVLLKSAR